MIGKIKLKMFDSKEDFVGTFITDFHFRLRDLESFFVTDSDAIVAVIGRIERVFEYDDKLIEEFERELSRS